MKPFKIISTRRAGTHFLNFSMKQNFDIKLSELNHTQPDLYHILLLQQAAIPVLIVRDGRDVLKSLYRYWYNDTQFTKEFRVKEVSFKDFIRGKTPVNPDFWERSYVRCLRDPINYWCEMSYLADIKHQEKPGGWNDSKPIYCVKFEDLKSNPVETLTKLKEHFNLTQLNDTITPLDKIVGPIGKVMDITWNDDDLKLFWLKAGNRMTRFGYKEKYNGKK